MASDQMIGDGRPMRPCSGQGIGCGRVDDHPRHTIDDGTEPGPMFHIDCHAAMGCESCAAQIQGSDGATGAELVQHLVANAPAVDTDTDTEEV